MGRARLGALGRWDRSQTSVRILIAIPADLKRLLEIHAVTNGATQASTITEALRAYLDGRAA